jgi:hypothetical protein
MDIGMNPGANVYFATCAFENRFKTAGAWIDPATKAVITGPFDADGYLTAMPAGTTIAQAIFGLDPGEARPTEEFVVTYKGKGTLRIAAGGTVKTSEPGRIVFTANKPTQGTAILQILSIDPTDYIRDIAVVRADGVERYVAGGIFRPEYAAMFKGFKVIRFMDWLQTNDPFVGHVPVSSYSYGKPRHVPVEICVAFANLVGAHPWLNVHDQGDAAYEDKFLLLASASKLRAIIEYSNEVWNSGFQQMHRAAAAGTKLWPNIVNTLYAAQTYCGYRSGQIGIKAEKMGMVVAMGTQPTAQQLAPYVFNGFALAGATTGVHAKYWTGTYYFNGTLTDPAGPAVDLMNAGNIAGAHANMLTETNRRGVPANAVFFNTAAKIAADHGMEYACYEGGPHLATMSLKARTDFATIKLPMVQFFAKTQQDPGIAPVYAANLDVLEASGCTLCCAFNLDGGATEFGYFGHYGLPVWGVLQDYIKKAAAKGMTGDLDTLRAMFNTLDGALKVLGEAIDDFSARLSAI